MNATVLEILKQNGVNFIALRSVGYDHVDLNKAQTLGIKVANIPEYSPYAIAEHAVTLLLALNRKVILANELMKTYDFKWYHILPHIIIKTPSVLFSKQYWIKTLFVKTYHAKYFLW